MLHRKVQKSLKVLQTTYYLVHTLGAGQELYAFLGPEHFSFLYVSIGHRQGC